MFRYFFSLALLLLGPWCFSQQDQEVPEDGSLVQPKTNWTPHELKLGVNAIRAGRSIFESDLTTMEVQLALAMHRAIAVLELGFEDNQRGDLFEYQNTGSFVRFGGDWNFVKDMESGNMISLGLRYARAGFEDELSYTQNLGFGEEVFQYANTTLNARWYEVTFNIRGKIVTNLFMGFTMRWQFSRKIKGEGELKTFDIPGFGTTSRENSTAFDYFIAWRIPLKKK